MGMFTFCTILVFISVKMSTSQTGSNEYSHMFSNARLKVNAKFSIQRTRQSASAPGPVTFSPPNKYYSLPVNRSIGPIFCESSCDPSCVYNWNGPGISLSSSQLYIANINKNHTGQYSCTARNTVGFSRNHVTVEVQYGPVSMVLIPDTSMTTVNESETIGPIKCKADCVPECTYRWSGQKFKENTSSLVIENAHISYNGSYMCHATNEFGNESVLLDVIVQCVPQFDLSVQSSPQDIMLQTGMDLNITINVISNPGPVVQMKHYQNDSSVTTLLTPTISKNGYKVTINYLKRNMSHSDFGLYFFCASNNQGVISKLFQVILEAKNESKSQKKEVILIGGISSSVVIIALVTFGLLLFITRRRRRQKKETNDGQKKYTELSDYKKPIDHVYDNVNDTNGQNKRTKVDCYYNVKM